ncbi:MAG: magnesium transporter [Bacteroidota bacterium]
MHINREELLNKHPSDIAETIAALNEQEQIVAFFLLPGDLEGEVFAYFERPIQENILKQLGSKEIAGILKNMSPDDRTEVFEDMPDYIIKDAINFLTEEERKTALSLIGYQEDSVGRMMTPYYIQVKKHWTVTQTYQAIKRFGKKAETLNFIYVVDDDLKLIDDIKIGKFLLADNDIKVEKLMDYDFVSLKTTMSKEDAIQLFEKYDREALPVTTESGVLLGIVTIDDILDTIEERDTEDIQKFGGLEALEQSYTETSTFELIKKRAGWLVILFFSELLTASVMSYFQLELDKAIVLALFVPLIISSGGNSGSQAATLIIRAMALKEIGLSDWWIVLRKEIISGLSLGLILGTFGFIRILIWQKIGLFDYTEHWFFVGLTVGLSLVGIVMWGTISGSMIPFVLRRFGLDPATSSAPFVATMVDVTGLIIYFTIASVLLSGKLL